MGQISSTRIIDAPPETVFDAIAHPENLTSINPDIVNVEFLTEQRSGVGTRFRETRIMSGKEAMTELEYTEHVVPEHVRIVTDSGGVVWDTVMSVAPHGHGGTELTMVMEDRPYKLAMKVMLPVIRGMISKAIHKDMDLLKAWCEQHEQR